MEPGFGAFGKIPALGDFFRLNAPHGFIPVWDAWLQQGLLCARQALASRWDEKYLSAPIWRFTLASGLAGNAKILGVLMPSVDRVGRQFPLTLMAPIDGQNSPLLDHFTAVALFADLEGLALDGLDDNMTRDRLCQGLGKIHLPNPGRCVPLASATNSLILTHGGATGLLPDLAAHLASSRFRRPSIFSAEVEGGPRLMICEGLPDAAQVLGLYDLDAPVWTGEVTR